MNKAYLLIIIVASCLLCSCSDDENADLSCLTAEMCDIYVSAPKIAVNAVTDSDRQLSFDSQLSVPWATKPDSVYRAMLYYNSPITSLTVSPLYAERVLLLTPHPKSKAAEWSENADPMEVNSIWQAKNGKYLNLGISLKNGSTTDDSQYHSIGLVTDTIIRSSAKAHHYYRVCHAQNDMPMHYTVRTYLSIPIASIPEGDTLTVSVPTDTGMKEMTVVK